MWKPLESSIPSSKHLGQQSCKNKFKRTSISIILLPAAIRNTVLGLSAHNHLQLRRQAYYRRRLTGSCSYVTSPESRIEIACRITSVRTKVRRRFQQDEISSRRPALRLLLTLHQRQERTQ
ncbi:hypothetical protein TNCV_2783011 [Trichonephila clavipes]|nr:hypothetical protein TNCV_2783011 [Trichonephila clavipes]